MITLITGAPGAGKSAAVVSMLAMLGKDRPVYVNGVTDLTLDHIPLSDDDLRDWPNKIPDGACVISDEVQRLWRPRGPGTKPPAEVQAFETHRHHGLDFYFISQKPTLIDKNIRDLAGRHVHLRDIGILGRWWYEWPEVSENCATGWKTAPIKKRYKLPKAIFNSYKSASLHVKPIRSFPVMLVVLIVAVLLTLGFGWRAYSIVQAKSHPPSESLQNAIDGKQLESIGGRPRVSKAFKLASFIPVDAAFPESAPAYDELRVVSAMRQVVAGFCSGDKCECRDNQGVVLQMDAAVCAGFVAHGRFNPYLRVSEPAKSGPALSGGSPAPSSAPVVAQVAS
jgi:zona occludens toxin